MVYKIKQFSFHRLRFLYLKNASIISNKQAICIIFLLIFSDYFYHERLFRTGGVHNSYIYMYILNNSISVSPFVT